MIKFPRVHIAESVKNRILNTRDELNSSRAPAAAAPPAPPPSVPDPELEGAELDNNIAQPPGELPPLETAEPGPDELAGAVARGDNLISA